MIFNENTKGDEEGEFTYTGARGKSMIEVLRTTYYGLRNEDTREGVEGLELGDKVDSLPCSGIFEMRRAEGKKKEKGEVDK